MSRSIRIPTFIVFCCVAGAFAVRGQEAPAPLRYEVEYQGVENGALLRELKRLAEAKNDPKQSPPSFSLLERQAREQIPDIRKLMQARGYYDAVVRTDMKREEIPAKLLFIIEPGEAYTVRESHFTLTQAAPEGLSLPAANAYPPAKGQPVEAESLLKAAENIRRFIAAHNCLLSVEVKPALELHPEEHTADVYYDIITGPKAHVGPITVSGNTSVKEKYIRRQLKWKEGDCYHAADIDDARTRLIKSQLFANVEVTPAKQVNAANEAPIAVTVKERFHRTVKAGLSYMTDEGPGATFGWEHRNFFGNGETLDTKAVISDLEYSLESHFTRPYFMRDDQSLKLTARIADERPAAYTSHSTEISGVVERELRKYLKAGVGMGYRLSEVKKLNDTETYGLFYAPLYAEWDNRDDLLNATKGIQARIDTAPYFDTLGSNANFMRTLGTARTYFRLTKDDKAVLAVKGTLGSITALSTRAVPADLRYYAGGGSSVRGYGYQKLSPIVNGEIYGGRSLLEISSEIRFKVTDTIGAVAFLDGGNAFDSPYPDFNNPLRWGTGLGARYYTDFGPLRLDIGTPLGRKHGESIYQIYVSLGQAF